MKDLFQPFHQVDASTKRRFGGTGLDLVISGQLAEQMGGKMWVERELAKGSTLYFAILAEPAIGFGTETAKAVGGGQVAEPAVKPSAASAEKTFAARYPYKILVTDDHPVNQQVAVLLLSCLGYGRCCE